MVQPTANSPDAAGDISLREWICWAGEVPAEPTSTLVLTAPSNNFLDIRLLLPTPLTPSAEAPLPNTGGPLTRLDWAFSGVAETLPPAVKPQMQHAAAQAGAPPLAPIDYSRLCDFGVGDGGVKVTVPRKRWNHIIDTNYISPRGQVPAPDEGEMYPVAGRPEACLEMGQMEREKGAGVATRYQELWVTVEAKLVGSETHRQGAVISLDMPEVCARGLIIRVAHYCQALLIIDDQIDIERWEYKVGTNGAPDGWQRVAKLGSNFLPCAWTFEGGEAMGEKVKVGSMLQYGGMAWKVQERFAW